MLMILSLKLRNPRAACKIFGEGVGAKMWTWMKLSWFSSAEEFSAQSHPLRHYFFKSHFRIKIWHKFLTLTEEVTNDGRTRRNLENNSFVWNFRLNLVQQSKILEYHWKLLPLNNYYWDVRSRDWQGTGRDIFLSWFFWFFVPVPLVPLDNHVGTEPRQRTSRFTTLSARLTNKLLDSEI